MVQVPEPTGAHLTLEEGEAQETYSRAYQRGHNWNGCGVSGASRRCPFAPQSCSAKGLWFRDTWLTIGLRSLRVSEGGRHAVGAKCKQGRRHNTIPRGTRPVAGGCVTASRCCHGRRRGRGTRAQTRHRMDTGARERVCFLCPPLPPNNVFTISFSSNQSVKQGLTPPPPPELGGRIWVVAAMGFRYMAKGQVKYVLCRSSIPSTPYSVQISLKT